MFELTFEHPDFLLIHKYPNVSVHKDEQKHGLLAEVARQTGDNQLYLIHRLDKMTSGLLLLGRNAKAASELSMLFSARKVEKYYLAVLSNKPKKTQGLICGGMEKSRRGMWKLTPNKANPAITQFFSALAQNGKRLAICKLHTGKTHQIRVAMKSLGAAILGDERYAGAQADRGYLHAFSLSFVYQGQRFCFSLAPTLGEHWPETLPLGWSTPQALLWPRLKG